MLNPSEIKAINFCKGVNLHIEDLRKIVAEYFDWDVEDTADKDIADFLYGIWYQTRINENKFSDEFRDLNFSIFNSLFDVNPEVYGLKRDKNTHWQNLCAILVSRIRLTNVDKLDSLGYVSNRPQGNNNP